MGPEVSGTPVAESVVAKQSTSSISAAVKRMTYLDFLDNSPMTPFLWVVLMGCLVGQVLDGFDFQSTTFALPLIAREFKITATQAGGIPSMTNFGLLLGALISGPFCDRFGRRPIFQWAVFLYAFGTLLSAIAPSYQFLLAARFIAGLGIAGEFPIVATILSEYSPKRLRHIFVGSYSVAYSMGFILCAVVATHFVPRFGWRSLYFIGATPVLMIVYIRRYVPESVRFLLAHNRVEEAGAIVRKLADKAGLTDVEMVPPPFVKGQARPTLLQQYSSLRFFAGTIIVLALFQIAGNLQTVGVAQWLPSIFMRQGFTLAKSFRFTMIGFAVVPLGQIFGIWLQNRVPRKWALLLLAAANALCFLGFGLSFEYKFPVALIVACNTANQFFANSVVPVVVTLATERFPTRIRGIGWGLISALGRIGSICGPLMLGFLLTLGTQIHEIIYYFSMPLVLSAVLIVIFIKGDARLKTLEEATGQ